MENTTAPVTKVKLSKKEVSAMLEAGVKKADIAIHFGLNANQMTKAFKVMGLNSVRAKKIEFEIVDEDVENVEDGVEASVSASFQLEVERPVAVAQVEAKVEAKEPVAPTQSEMASANIAATDEF